ncbi:MAG TPA: PIN domain-containing protein [Thermoflexales bacterium]|nr:PIN domain-containing protein [Thermoflexales bacterium]
MQTITIDASVFVSAVRAKEPDHENSLACLTQMRQTSVRLFLPTLVLAEVVAALSRTGFTEENALAFALRIAKLPNITFISLDEALAREASALAARHKLRGANSIYLATAALVGATLITLDNEQRERSTEIVNAISPRDFLNLSESQ